jgi:hypothetical protein
MRAEGGATSLRERVSGGRFDVRSPLTTGAVVLGLGLLCLGFVADTAGMHYEGGLLGAIGVYALGLAAVGLLCAKLLSRIAY